MTYFRNFLSSTAVAATCLLAMPAMAATYKTDQGHSEVRFGWSHAGVSMQTAEFTSFEGTLDLDPENVEAASLSATIQVGSLASGYEPLDKDLLSEGFLNATSFPEITFVSTGIERTGDSTANVTGDLTILGTTQSVVLETTLTHIGDHPVAAFFDSYKGDWVAFTATTTLDHQAFGVGSFSTGPITVEIVTEMKAAE